MAARRLDEVDDPGEERVLVARVGGPRHRAGLLALGLLHGATPKLRRRVLRGDPREVTALEPLGRCARRERAPQAEPFANTLRVSNRDRFADSHRPRKPFALRMQQVDRDALGQIRGFAVSRHACGAGRARLGSSPAWAPNAARRALTLAQGAPTRWAWGWARSPTRARTWARSARAVFNSPPQPRSCPCPTAA